MMYMNLNDNAIIKIHDVDYRCIVLEKFANISQSLKNLCNDFVMFYIFKKLFPRT